MLRLSDIQDLNLDRLEDHLCIVAGGHPMNRIGEEMELLCKGFQSRGICRLLLEFDTDAFFLNLQRSGHARRYFLRKGREQGFIDPIFPALSRTDALFDCVASGNWSLASEIQDLSPTEWMRDGEYEEDYCYHRVIHALVDAALGRGGRNSAAGWQRRLERVVANIPGAAIDVSRFELCTRFLEDGEDAFWKAFEVLVAASGEAAAAVPLADGRVYDFPWLAPSRYVSVELLAWVALARNRGFTSPEREYNRCPSVAWISGAAQPAPDLFLEIESRFDL